MKGKLKKILSLFLAVALVAGMIQLPAGRVKAAGTEPEFSIRFEDTKGNPITKAEPGTTVVGIVSVSNADRLTGLVMQLHYDKTKMVPAMSKWSQDITNYEDRIVNGYIEDDIVPGTADNAAKGINFETMDYISIVWVTANKDATNQITTKGMGDIDLCSIYFKISGDAEGEYGFETSLETYHLDGDRDAELMNPDEHTSIGSFTVEREPVPMTGFTLNEKELSLDLSSDDPTAQLSVASYEPADTTDKDNKVTWSVEGDAVKVDDNGLVTAVKKGTATVKASIENHDGNTLTQSCEVTVTKSVKSVTIDSSAITLAQGQTKQLSATVSPTDADNSTVKWESDAPGIATVTQDGLVKAVGENGTANIRAYTENGKEDICTVTVKTSHLEKIELNKEETSIARGKTEKLNVTFTPDLDNVTDKVSNITWGSNNEAVATVSDDGTVTAVGRGETTVTATVESNNKQFTAECKVRVYVPVEKFTVSTPVIPSAGGTFLKGAQTTVYAGLEPEDADTYEFEWTVDAPEIASINPADDGKSCMVFAEKAGIAIITVTEKISGIEKTIPVTVTEIPINTINVTASSTELNKDTTTLATAEVLPANTTDEDKTVTWKSSNEGVATVDENGLITAVGGGEADITATSNARPDVAGSVHITVDVPLQSITYKEGTEDTELIKGQETTLTVIYNPEDTTADKTVAWECTGEAASLKENQDGTATVTAEKEGTVTVKATVSGKSVEKKITVKEIRLEGVELSVDGEKTIDLKDGAFDIQAILTPDNITDKIESVTWDSSEEKVATVEGEGLDATVTPVASGTTKISVKVTTDAGTEFSAECEIRVVIPMTGIKVVQEGTDVTGTTIALLKGEKAELSYKADPENTTDVISSVTWKSENPETVSVEQNGAEATVTTIKESEKPIRITVTAELTNGKELSSDVYISAEEIHIESIALSETDITLESAVKEEKQLEVTYSPDNTTDQKTVIWASSQPSVATVENGLVTAVAPGEAIITARTENGKTASCHVKVPLHITEVTASDMKLRRGEQKALEAAVVPEVSDDDDTLAYEIVFDKGNPEAISLEGNVVTAVKEGTAYVKVTAVNAYGDEKPSVTVPVTVKEIPLEQITVTVNGEKDENGVYQIRADEKDPKIDVTWPKEVTDDVSVKYEVTEGADIVSVDEYGNLSFLAEGYATITATATATDGAGNEEEFVQTCRIYVKVIALESITFADDSKDLTINEGQEKTLTVLYTPEDTTDKDLTWTSSDTAIATIVPGENGTAVVKGIKAGTVTIKAVSSEGLEAVTTVTVKAVEKPADEDGSQGTVDDQNSSDNSKNPSADGGKTSDKAEGAVQTGDTANPMAYGITAVIALAVILLVMRKRIKHV